MRFVRTAESIFGLPAGFQRAEYLQSTGTQYIDLGIGVKSNTVFKAIFSIDSTATGRSYFGARNSSNERFQIVNSIGIGGGYYLVNNVYPVANKKYEIEMHANGDMYLDGVKRNATTGTFSQVAFERHLWLFATNYYDSSVGAGASTFWKAQIFEGDVLVRDFIPCIDPLGVACMFDLVGKKPYYNQGTGTFTAGRQIIPVNYLESTGIQYIDTGVGGDLTTELTCEAAIVQAGNASVTNIMGNNVTSTRAITINISANISNPSPSRIRFGNTDTTTVAGAINLNTFYKYDTNKNELTVRDSGGTVLNTYSFNATTAFTTNGNILIYKLGDTSTQYIGKIKVKSATIKNSSVLVRDFIPCKDENNVGFMFDTLSGTVYLNAGTGAFSVGEPVYTSKLRLIKDAKELPNGYKRVEYIASSGTQYIDTGVYPTQLTEVEYRCAVTGSVANNDSHLFGSILSASSEAFDLAYMNTQPNGIEKFRFIHGTTTTQETTTSVTASQLANPHTYYMSGTSFKVDGSEKMSFTTSSFTGSYSLWLFGVNSAGSLHNQVRAQRVYKCKIWNNGTLVRDFIPCLDSNNRPCMYDRVNGVTYYNQGTGEFTYGHTITPVEYIESTGTQYINTGIKLDNNSSVELYYQLTQAVQNRKGLFGGLDTGGSKRFGALLSPSNNQLEGGYGSGNEFYQLGLPDTNIHVIKQEKNLLYFDGSLVYTFNTATFTQSFNAPLGNFTFTNYNPASAKYYRSKWWDNGTLVRSFIPVRDENNVGYMFDEVTGQIFGNAGSGSFGIGNDLPTSKVRFIQDVLPREYRPLKYLQSTGTQYIDTGYKPNSNTKVEAKFKMNETPNKFKWLFLARDANVAGGGFGFGCNANGYITSDYNNRQEASEKLTSGTTYVVTKDKNVCKYNNSTLTNTESTFTVNYNLPIFTLNNIGTFRTDTIPLANCYYFVIYDNGVPVRDLYPALRKSDNKPGMYDRITKQFFTNQGTGEFNYEV